MTTGNFHLDLIIGGIIGQLFHIFIIKLPALKNRYEKANERLTIGKYFSNDWIAIGASLITIIVAVFVIDEILNFKPSIKEWVKFFFVFIGYTGSSVLQTVLSKTEKKIQDVVDEKTNKADADCEPDPSYTGDEVVKRNQ